MIAALVGPVVKILGTVVGGFVDRAQAKTEQRVAESKSKAVIAEKMACGDIEWDSRMAAATEGSWKDEYLTLLVSVPMIMVFMGHEVQVLSAFKVLEEMPTWYQVAIGGVFTASFGIKALGNRMFNKG